MKLNRQSGWSGKKYSRIYKITTDILVSGEYQVI